MVVDDYSYDRIVSEYNRFDQSWNALMPQLRGNQNSYIERTVTRLSSANYAVHELLWMENTTSRAELKQTADILIHDVDEFYKRTSLLLLLNFRNAGQTMEVASEFYGTVQNFRDNLERSESDAQIVESYRYVEEYGAKFISTFRQMKSQAAIVVLQEIEEGIAALRRELNLGGSSAAVDLVRLRPIAASLEDLADQMNVDVRQWLNSERPTFRNEASTVTQAFVRRTQNLHKLVDAEQRSQDLQSEVDALYNDWKQVYSYLERCRTADRSNLAWRARLINEALVDLDTQLRP
jgi:HPt (histidine-containing phosphotransfer) domain-containing protein